MIVLAGMVSAMFPGSVEGEGYNGDRHVVRYHLYQTEPTVYEGFNTDTGAGSTDVSVDVEYHGGVISTEYNPQVWSGTFKDKTGTLYKENWYPISTYKVDTTLVFTGWVYAQGTGFSEYRYPGEVMSDGEIEAATGSDGVIHVYATWDYLDNYSTSLSFGTFSGGNEYTNMVVLNSGTYYLPYIGSSSDGLTIRGGSGVTLNLYASQGTCNLSQNTIIDSVVVSGNFDRNHGDGNAGLYATGHVLVIGTGVVTEGSSITDVGYPETAYPQIVGGSNGSKASLNVERTPLGESDPVTLGTLLILHSGTYGNVVAGSRGGSVDGSTYVVLKDVTVLDTLVGACSSTGEVSGSTYVYATSLRMSGDYYEEYQLDPENIEVPNILESTIITGGSNNGSVGGDTHVFISGDSEVWDVQGAGRRGDSTVSGTAMVEVSGEAIVKHTVCGSITDGLESGTNEKCVDSTDIRIKDSAAVGAVFGAGYDTFYEANYVSMMDGGTIHVTLEGSCTVGYVYGGGYRGSIGTSSQPLDSVIIEIRGGTVLGDVFGGGRGGLDKITHNTDGTYQWSESAYDTTGHSIVYADHVSVTVSGGNVRGNVYGGGESVPIVTSYNGHYYLDGYLGGSGSGEVAAVHCDDISVIITGGTVGGDVYGSGKGVDSTDLDFYDSNGKPTEVLKEGGYSIHSSAYIFAIQKTDAGYSIVKIPWLSGSGGTELQDNAESYSDFAEVDTKAVTVTINNAAVDGSVYGGGEYGRLGPEEGSTRTSVSIDLGKNADIGGSVYGGGYGQSNVISTNVLSRTVTINGADIGGSVYGGSRYGDDNCSSSNGSVSTYGYDQGNVIIRVISGTIASGSSGNVYGGGYRGYSNMDTEVLIGVPAMEEGQNPVSDHLEINSIYGGASVGESDNYDNNTELLLGDSKVIIGNLFEGSKNTPYTGGFVVSGDVFGEGDYCSISGESSVEFRGFVQESSLLSVQKSDELKVIGSELDVIGNVDGSSSHASERLSLNLIQSLILMKDNYWGPSTLSLHSAASQIGAYASLGVDGQPDIPQLTSESVTMNTIDMYGGMIFSILGKDNSGDVTSMGDITGYTLIGNGGSGYYGTFAMGVTSQVQIGTTGFIVKQEGNGYVAAQEASYNYSEVGVTMWYITGVYKVESTVVLQDVQGSDGPSESVTVIVPKTVKSSSIMFVGGYVNSSSPGSLNLVDQLGSTTPGRDFVVTVGRVSDTGYIHFGTAGQTAMPDSSVQFEGNGMYMSIDVATNSGYINTGYAGSITLHMVEIMGSIPINTFDVEVGVYLRTASTTENITNIFVMRPKDEGGSNDYTGSVDVYLPVLANNAMARYTLEVLSADGSLTVVASPTNLHKNGWQSIAVNGPTSITTGESLYMGVGGVFAPVLRFDYEHDFEQTPQEVEFKEITLRLTLTNEITGETTVYELILKPELAVKLDLTFKDKYLTYENQTIGWSEYFEILTLTMDFGTDMSNVYVAVNSSFHDEGKIGEEPYSTDSDYISKVAESISGRDGNVLLSDSDGIVFGSMIYVNNQIQGRDYQAMLVSDFLENYVGNKPNKAYGTEETFDYSDHPGWYDTSECMTPFNFESVISNNLDVYAGYGIAIYIVPFIDPENPDAADKKYSVSPEYVLLGNPGSEVDLMDVYETLTITSGYDKVSSGTVWWYKDSDGKLKGWDLGSDYKFNPQADFTAYLRLERVQYSITLMIDGQQQTFSSDYSVKIGDVESGTSSAFYGDDVDVSFEIGSGLHIGNVTGTVPNGSFDRFQISTDGNENTLSFTMPAGDLAIYVTTTDKNTVSFELPKSGTNDNGRFGIKVVENGSVLSVELVQGLAVSTVTVSTSTSTASVAGSTDLGIGGVLISAYVGEKALCTLKEGPVELDLSGYGDNITVSIHVSVKWGLEIEGEGYNVHRDALSDPRSGTTTSDTGIYSSSNQCAYVLTGDRLEVSATNGKTLVSISHFNLGKSTSTGGTFEFSVPGTGNASIYGPIFSLTLTIIVDFTSDGADVAAGDWVDGKVTVSTVAGTVEPVIVGGDLEFTYTLDSGTYEISANYVGFSASPYNEPNVNLDASNETITLKMIAIDYNVNVSYPATGVNITQVWHVWDTMTVGSLVENAQSGLSDEAVRWFGYVSQTDLEELGIGDEMTVDMFGTGKTYTLLGVPKLAGEPGEELPERSFTVFLLSGTVDGTHAVSSGLIEGSYEVGEFSVTVEAGSLILDGFDGTVGTVVLDFPDNQNLTVVIVPEGTGWGTVQTI